MFTDLLTKNKRNERKCISIQILSYYTTLGEKRRKYSLCFMFVLQVEIWEEQENTQNKNTQNTNKKETE